MKGTNHNQNYAALIVFFQLLVFTAPPFSRQTCALSDEFIPRRVSHLNPEITLIIDGEFIDPATGYRIKRSTKKRSKNKHLNEIVSEKLHEIDSKLDGIEAKKDLIHSEIQRKLFKNPTQDSENGNPSGDSEINQLESPNDINEEKGIQIERGKRGKADEEKDNKDDADNGDDSDKEAAADRSRFVYKAAPIIKDGQSKAFKIKDVLGPGRFEVIRLPDNALPGSWQFQLSEGADWLTSGDGSLYSQKFDDHSSFKFVPADNETFGISSLRLMGLNGEKKMIELMEFVTFPSSPPKIELRSPNQPFVVQAQVDQLIRNLTLEDLVAVHYGTGYESRLDEVKKTMRKLPSDDAELNLAMTEFKSNLPFPKNQIGAYIHWPTDESTDTESVIQFDESITSDADAKTRMVSLKNPQSIYVNTVKGAGFTINLTMRSWDGLTSPPGLGSIIDFQLKIIGAQPQLIKPPKPLDLELLASRYNEHKPDSQPNINLLARNFFDHDSDRLGIAVIGASSKNGSWEYFDQNEWKSFPAGLQKALAMQEQNLENNDIKINDDDSFSIYGSDKLGGEEAYSTIYLPGSSNIRFAPKDNTSVWGDQEAKYTSVLAFFGWNGFDVDSNFKVASIDVKNCKEKCGKLGLSTSFVITAASREGCDEKLGSKIAVDICGVCGGDGIACTRDTCLDCHTITGFKPAASQFYQPIQIALTIQGPADGDNLKNLKCSLINFQNTSLTTPIQNIVLNPKNDSFADVSGSVANLNVGNYLVSCVALSSPTQESIFSSTNPLLEVRDFSLFGFTTDKTMELSLGLDGSVDVAYSGIFSQKNQDVQYCFEKGYSNHYKVSVINESFAICHLVEQRPGLALKLRYIADPDGVDLILEHQKPLVLNMYDPEPRIVGSGFENSLGGIAIKFDMNVEAPERCDQIFVPSFYTKLGAEPQCDIRADVLHVALSEDATLVPSDELKILPKAIYKQGSTAPDLRSYLNIPKNWLVGPPELKVIPRAIITAKPVHYTCSLEPLTVTAHADGHGRRPMAYFWTASLASKIPDFDQKLLDETTDAIKSSLSASESQTINSSLLIPNTIYSFKLRVCNFYGECSPFVQQNVTILEHSDSPFSVTILGKPLVFRQDEKLTLKAEINSEECVMISNNEEEFTDLQSIGLTFSWMVQADDQILYEHVGSVMRVPKDTAPAGSTVKISVIVLAKLGTANVNASDFVVMKSTSGPVEMAFSNQELTIGRYQTVTLNALKVQDDDKNIQCTWECFYGNNSEITTEECIVEQSGNKIPFTTSGMTSLKTLAFSNGALEAKIHKFKVSCQSPHSLPSTSNLTLEVLPGMLPKIFISPLGAVKHNPKSECPLKASIIAHGNVTMQWKVLKQDGFSFIQFPSAFAGFLRKNAVIYEEDYLFEVTIPASNDKRYTDWKGFNSGTKYLLHLEVSSANGTASATMALITNSPPLPGSLLILPVTDRFSLITRFTFACNNWIDDSQDYPLSYKFGYMVTFVNDTNATSWFPRSGQDSVFAYLPAANPTSMPCERKSVKVFVEVCDILQSCSEMISPEFYITSPDNVTDEITALTKLAVTESRRGDGFSGFQKTAAALEEICYERNPVLLEASAAIAGDILADFNDENDPEDAVLQMSQVNNLMTNGQFARSQSELIASYLDSTRKLTELLGLVAEKSKSITKRAISPSNGEGNVANIKKLTVEEADAMILAYETIVSLDSVEKNFEEYLAFTVNLMKRVCITSNPSQGTQSYKASKNPAMQLEVTVKEMDAIVTNRKINLACLKCTFEEDKPKILLGSKMYSKYRDWKCNGGSSTCTSICLGSIEFPIQYPPAKYITSTNDPLTASNFFYFDVMDPRSGESLNDSALSLTERATVYIPLLKSVPNGTPLQCRIKVGKVWTSKFCQTQLMLKTDEFTPLFLSCQCTKTGFIAAFQSCDTEDVVITYSISGEVNKILKDESDETAYIMKLSNATGIKESQVSEFQYSGNSKRTSITFVLHPICPDSTISKETLEMLNKTLGYPPDYLATPATGLNNDFQLTDVKQPDKLATVLDGKARIISFRILSVAYDNAVVTDGILNFTSTVTKQLAAALSISPDRIRTFTVKKAPKPIGAFDIVFTVSAAVDANSEQSAEEIAWKLRQQITRDLLQLVDPSGDPLVIDKTSFVSQKQQDQKLASSKELPMIIGAVVGSTFVIVLVTAVILLVIKHKGRTEKISPTTSPNGTPPGSAAERSEQPQNQNFSAVRPNT